MSTYVEWGDALELELQQPFPPEDVYEKNVQGGGKVPYVPVFKFIERLNNTVGSGWSVDLQPMHIKDKVVVRCALTIFGVTRVSLGDEDDEDTEEVMDPQTGELREKRTMYGSPSTNAEAQAFKRACSKFGMGLDLYDKRRRGQQQRQPQQRQPQQQPQQNQAPQQPAQRDPQVEALRLRLKQKLDTAADALVINVEESARVEAAIASGDRRRIENATTFLDQRLDPARLGA